ncbi:hypothetical protein CEXT_574171 [Caerostris extrusa]|uniref:Uncharacterized protein n=1 Tax=Caerostris extrusa TaxID=172846 RepID=A0AAV4MBH4_CAEEX|nr:hypothetical protein CEXT_574171 [Caerostris extrusa]
MFNNSVRERKERKPTVPYVQSIPHEEASLRSRGVLPESSASLSALSHKTVDSGLSALRFSGLGTLHGERETFIKPHFKEQIQVFSFLIKQYG